MECRILSEIRAASGNPVPPALQNIFNLQTIVSNNPGSNIQAGPCLAGLQTDEIVKSDFNYPDTPGAFSSSVYASALQDDLDDNASIPTSSSSVSSNDLEDNQNILSSDFNYLGSPASSNDHDDNQSILSSDFNDLDDNQSVLSSDFNFLGSPASVISL